MLPYIKYQLDSKTHKRIWFNKRNVRDNALRSLVAHGIAVEVRYLDSTQQKVFIVSNEVYDALNLYYTKNRYADMSVGEFVKLMTE